MKTYLLSKIQYCHVRFLGVVPLVVPVTTTSPMKNSQERRRQIEDATRGDRTATERKPVVINRVISWVVPLPRMPVTTRIMNNF